MTDNLQSNFGTVSVSYGYDIVCVLVKYVD